MYGGWPARIGRPPYIASLQGMKASRWREAKDTVRAHLGSRAVVGVALDTADRVLRLRPDRFVQPDVGHRRDRHPCGLAALGIHHGVVPRGFPRHTGRPGRGGPY